MLELAALIRAAARAAWRSHRAAPAAAPNPSRSRTRSSCLEDTKFNASCRSFKLRCTTSISASSFAQGEVIARQRSQQNQPRIFEIRFGLRRARPCAFHFARALVRTDRAHNPTDGPTREIILHGRLVGCRISRPGAICGIFAAGCRRGEVNERKQRRAGNGQLGLRLLQYGPRPPQVWLSAKAFSTRGLSSGSWNNSHQFPLSAVSPGAASCHGASGCHEGGISAVGR